MKEVYNQEEMLAILGCGKRRLAFLVKNGNLPAIKIGGTYCFLRKSVLEWLEDNQVNPPEKKKFA